MQCNTFISYSLLSGNAFSPFNSLARDQYIGYMPQAILRLWKFSIHVNKFVIQALASRFPCYLTFAEQVEFITPEFSTHTGQGRFGTWESQKLMCKSYSEG